MNQHSGARHDDACERGGLAELVLAGLVPIADEDELLGDLAEGRARWAAVHGERSARRWYRSQVLRALPSLIWHGLTTHFGFVMLGVLSACTVTAVVSLGGGMGGFYDSRISPEPRDVLAGTILRGAALLLAGAVGGALAARLARGARLVPVVLVAAYWSLWAWQGPFYAVYGSAVQVSADEYVVDLSPTSDQLVIPVFWQLPTMAVAMPAMTLLGGVAAVAWLRRRNRRRAALSLRES
ncbi:hypothetical protein [Pengzhenrongella phosphoraccumulans]|uniref:hypothetical protein n=1 Tax=Pengzhenrongella phosphoraccumulans TaxID=3114394 RepID=UPI00388F380C